MSTTKKDLMMMLEEGRCLSEENTLAYEAALDRGDLAGAMVAIGEVAAIEARMAFVRQILGLEPVETMN